MRATAGATKIACHADKVTLVSLEDLKAASRLLAVDQQKALAEFLVMLTSRQHRKIELLGAYLSLASMHAGSARHVAAKVRRQLVRYCADRWQFEQGAGAPPDPVAASMYKILSLDPEIWSERTIRRRLSEWTGPTRP